MKQTKAGAKDGASRVSKLGRRPVRARYENVPANLRPNWEVVIRFLIDDVSRLQRAALDRILKPIGGSRAQWALMSHIARHPGMKQIELAGGLDLSRVAIKLLTDRLLKNGIIAARPDPEDGRARRIFLTKNGKRLLEELRKAGFAFLAEVSDKISPQERRALIKHLSKMKQLIVEHGDERRRGRRSGEKSSRC